MSDIECEFCERAEWVRYICDNCLKERNNTMIAKAKLEELHKLVTYVNENDWDLVSFHTLILNYINKREEELKEGEQDDR